MNTSTSTVQLIPAHVPAYLLKAGWGYWDTTQYPFGGCFKRTSVDMLCMVTGKEYLDYAEVKLGDGRMAFVKRAALTVVNGGAQ